MRTLFHRSLHAALLFVPLMASAVLAADSGPAAAQKASEAAGVPSLATEAFRVSSYNSIQTLIGVALVVGLIVCMTGLTLLRARRRDASGKTRIASTVGARLMANAGLVLVLMAAMAAVTIISISFINGELRQVADVETQLSKSVTEIQDLRMRQSVWLERCFRYATSSATGASQHLADAADKVRSLGRQADQKAKEAQAELQRNVYPNEELAAQGRDAASQLRNIHERGWDYDSRLEITLAALQAGQWSENYAAEQARMSDEMIEACDACLDHSEDRIAGLLDRIRGHGAWTRVFVILFALAAVLLGTGVSWAATNSVTRPLERIGTIAQAVSVGRLGERFSSKRSDEVSMVGMAFNHVGEVLNDLVQESERLTHAARAGNLTERGDPNRFKGVYAELIQGLNGTAEALEAPVQMTSRYLDRISKGDIPPLITDEYAGDFDAIKRNLNTLISVTKGLERETARLTTSILQGKLGETGDADAFEGAWRELVSGINNLVSAFVAPIRTTAESLEKISRGEMPQPIRDEYQGEFNAIKNSVNTLIRVMTDLLGETSQLTSSILAGRLDARGEASHFEGDWAKQIEGINQLVAAFVKPIRRTADCVEKIGRGEMPEKIREEYQGDFNLIKNSLNACIELMSGLLEETESLTQAAVQGRLDQRGNAEKFLGGWKRLVGGFNETLNRIVEPIGEASQVLQAVAERDLTTRIEGSYRGDHARIKEALNEALDHLGDSFSQVAAASDQVAAAAGQLSDGAVLLSQSTSEQAGSLAQISTNMQEVAGQTRQNSEAASSAQSQLDNALDKAREGVENMRELSEGMERIKESSLSTAKIVKNIDEIAFQSNLLALNATVEAARAGEAGRGFAVVAEEVRKLALSSAESAKDTAAKIEESVRNASAGVALTERVVLSLSEIDTQVKRVAEVMRQIVEASKSQTKSIEQVSVAVETINEQTQLNAANSEESSATAEELSGQAVELRSIVGLFKIPASARGASSGWVNGSPAQIEAEEAFLEEDEPAYLS